MPKGILQPGADGDLVIIDPDKEYVITHDKMHSAVDYTAYEGMKVKGQIDLVMQRGRDVYKRQGLPGYWQTAITPRNALRYRFLTYSVPFRKD